MSSIYDPFSLKKKKKTLLIIKSIKIVYSLKFLISHRIYGVHFSMGHSLLDFSLKEEKKKTEPEETRNEHRRSKREEGKVHSEKGRINCTRKASVNTTG